MQQSRRVMSIRSMAGGQKSGQMSGHCGGRGQLSQQGLTTQRPQTDGLWSNRDDSGDLPDGFFWGQNGDFMLGESATLSLFDWKRS
ncbi:hypothetical protein AVEN_84644-1 [Araneus ventricosus]|uniref:Uncharacterized protein n=1 Tax=Araneus ventricosus TaxID=182803 RepID=A0A4Y2HK62_ARAVE|nr:hypothetical protein AVEN_84644-1 [Araneus ventricosus]